MTDVPESEPFRSIRNSAHNADTSEAEILIFVGTHGNWSLYKPHFSEVVEMMADRFKEQRINAEPMEIIEVTVTKRAYVSGMVRVDSTSLDFDGEETP